MRTPTLALVWTAQEDSSAKEKNQNTNPPDHCLYSLGPNNQALCEDVMSKREEIDPRSTPKKLGVVTPVQPQEDKELLV